MNPTVKTIVLGAAVSLGSASGMARADWIVRAGAAWAEPEGDGLALPSNIAVPAGIGANSQINAQHAGPEIAGDLTWLFTRNVGLEFWINAPFQADLRLKGSSGSENLGSTRYMSPMLSLQWHFVPDGNVRPYLGAGVHHTTFSDTPYGHLDSQTNWTAGAGIDFGPPHGGWILNIYAKYLALHPDGTFTARSTIPGVTPPMFPPPPSVSQPVANNVSFTDSFGINPWIFGISVGWRFGHAGPVAAAAPAAAAAAESTAAPTPEPAPPAEQPPSACPDTPPGVRVGPMGCPCEMTVQLQFKFDSADLTEEDQQRLDKAAETLKRLHWISGTIEGHTDSTGQADYNQRLSEHRATTVRDYLISKGVGDDRVKVVGFGETKPIADNATPEGRAQNRRVVIRRTDCDEPK